MTGGSPRCVRKRLVHHNPDVLRSPRTLLDVPGLWPSLQHSGIIICKAAGKPRSYSFDKANLMTAQKVLINGSWRAGNAAGTFQAENPATKTVLPDLYPVGTWADCDAALNAAASAFGELQR